MIRSAGRAWAVLAFVAALPGCNCQEGDTDAGIDSGSNLLTTTTVVAVATTVAGIQRLHVTLSPLGDGACSYAGQIYVADVPEIAVGDLDLACPDTTNPFDCPLFAVAWTGFPAGAYDIGVIDILGVGEIDCVIGVLVEGLDVGGNVVATGASTGASFFAYYGATLGPNMVIELL